MMKKEMKKKEIQAAIERECEIFGHYSAKSMASFLKAEERGDEGKKTLRQDSVELLKLLQKLWILTDIPQETISDELSERIKLSDKLLKKGIRARKDDSYRSTKLP